MLCFSHTRPIIIYSKAFWTLRTVGVHVISCDKISNKTAKSKCTICNLLHQKNCTLRGATQINNDVQMHNQRFAKYILTLKDLPFWGSRNKFYVKKKSEKQTFFLKTGTIHPLFTISVHSQKTTLFFPVHVYTFANLSAPLSRTAL